MLHNVILSLSVSKKIANKEGMYLLDTCATNEGLITNFIVFTIVTVPFSWRWSINVLPAKVCCNGLRMVNILEDYIVFLVVLSFSFVLMIDVLEFFEIKH